MPPSADVCVLLPTLNESATIADVIRAYQEAGFSNILVVDGGSGDGTRELAREAGAAVITQSGEGKGQAIREAVEAIEADYVLMADADMTYRAEDAERMLEPLLVGDFEHVIGNRFADMEPGAMTKLNRIGNRLINRGFQFIHGEDYRDILSGYRAFRTDSFERLTLSADGFGIETEMAVECAKNGIKTEVVPITYRERPDGSATNLHPIKDGGIIFLELYRKAKTSNPLFYFGSVGLLSTASGLALAAFVIFRWVRYNIGHEIVAVGATAAILFGVQLLMFGVLADLILSLHHEQLTRIDRLEADTTPEPTTAGSDSTAAESADSSRSPPRNAE
ncbi:MAG: S-layer glycoprotein N-glycosyltransferase AglJ [Euryarchaeota archaeon]|nr:S-layer glycoprotein N-glycosyltransferase AglJ [Euryarchaeota archaeon]